MTKTFHVFPFHGKWVVRKEGAEAEFFLSEREAIAAARKNIKQNTSGQFVVHGKNGQIRQHESRGMIRIQDPPKKSPLAARIRRAIGQISLERVQSGLTPLCDPSPQK